MKKIVLYLIIFFAFGVGGTLQFLGILSNTITTFFLTMLAMIPVVLHIVRRGKLRVDNAHIILALLSFHIVLSGILNGKGLVLILFYFLIILLPYSLFNLLNIYLNERTLRKTMIILTYIGIIQLPIIIFQSVIAKTAVKFAARPISDYDFKFGTFFLDNDHALGFFIVALITFLLFNPASGKVIKNRNFVVVWLCLTVLVSNSKVTYLTLAFVLGTFFIRYITVKHIIYSSILLVITSIVVLSTNLRHIVEYNINDIQHNLQVERAVGDSRIIYEAGFGGRATVLHVWFNDPLKIIGEGPNSFFNPVAKDFIYSRVFGQFLWIYYDLGVIGLILTILFMIAMARKYRKTTKYHLVLLVIFLVYAFMHNVLQDLASSLIFFFFLASGNITVNPEPALPQDKNLEYELS